MDSYVSAVAKSENYLKEQGIYIATTIYNYLKNIQLSKKLQNILRSALNRIFIVDLGKFYIFYNDIQFKNKTRKMIKLIFFIFNIFYIR